MHITLNNKVLTIKSKVDIMLGRLLSAYVFWGATNTCRNISIP
ncbi:hypothetical protein VAE122_3040153 [Vibrio aestuarianus]|nr:hypothetical protein VAE122_3040153 [Vibrio aestuarianus]